MKIRILFLLLFVALLNIGLVNSQDNEDWLVRATSKNNYNGVTLSNGRIGLVSGEKLFSVSDIIVNGVYDKESEVGVSRIIRGPVFTNMNIRIDGQTVSEKNISGWSQVLNMKEATLTTSVNVGSTAHIDYTIMALRNLPYMGMVVIEITPNKDILFSAENETAFPVELKQTRTTFKLLKDAEIELPVFSSEAVTNTGMHHVSSCTAFLFDDKRPDIQAAYNIGSHMQTMSFEKSLKKGEKYRFALVGAICSTGNFKDVISEAERMSVYAMQSKIDFLLSGHKGKWASLWEGDIIIEGNPDDQRDVRLALYHLYSFTRENTRLSIAPMGLSTATGYNGHIFWDTELWMFPPLLMFNQGIARSLIDYRYDRLEKACQRAEAYGYEGAMFPWESDDSGEEATPSWCLTGPFEHHITADIGIAFWNYYRVYRDKGWLSENGYPLLKKIADYWISRVVKNNDGTYSINNVVGADEFAQNIDDNAFTNGSVTAVLRYAQLAAIELGLKPDTRWKDVGEHIKFHYTEDGITKEHATYKGETIKQGDVNLLAYPLEVVIDPVQIKRDLSYYEPKIFEDGPAMGNAVLSILYSRLGDKEKAYRLFKSSYTANKRLPFGVLSESAYSNNPYFATGAGGLLQAVVNGFGGLEITDKGVVQRKTSLPLEWKSLTIKGVGPEKKTYIIK